MGTLEGKVALVNGRQLGHRPSHRARLRPRRGQSRRSQSRRRGRQGDGAPDSRIGRRGAIRSRRRFEIERRSGDGSLGCGGIRPARLRFQQCGDHSNFRAAARAAGWSKWWGTFERGAQKLSDRMVELADVRPGSRVLDVATGIGEPAVTAARRAGPSGSVVGIDLAPGMLAIARQRAETAGLANTEFLEMDAEAPALPENSFDAILCRWGLMFFTDLEASLARLRRLLAPGGRLVGAVWGDPSRVPLISIRAQVVQECCKRPLRRGRPERSPSAIPRHSLRLSPSPVLATWRARPCRLYLISPRPKLTRAFNRTYLVRAWPRCSPNRPSARPRCGAP